MGTKIPRKGLLLKAPAGSRRRSPRDTRHLEGGREASPSPPNRSLRGCLIVYTCFRAVSTMQTTILTTRCILTARPAAHRSFIKRIATVSKHGARVASGAFHVGVFNEIDAYDDFLPDAHVANSEFCSTIVFTGMLCLLTVRLLVMSLMRNIIKNNTVEKRINIKAY